ncbi:MAG: hypothetical protein LUB60_00320, partial [Clostridiales bacterium]|nr:hypothetical protein [Clostridiales bacterium]
MFPGLKRDIRQQKRRRLGTLAAPAVPSDLNSVLHFDLSSRKIWKQLLSKAETATKVYKNKHTKNPHTFYSIYIFIVNVK